MSDNFNSKKIIHLSYILIFIILFAASNNLLAQKDETVGSSGSSGTNVGTTAAAFLEIGVGARAQAMGGAFTAITQDVNSMYWNTAGIGRLSGFEATFSHIDWILDANFDYFGIATPISDIFSIGANVTIFGVGEQPVRTVQRVEGTGEFYTAQDIAIGVSLGINLTDRFSFGINAKFIDQRIWHSSATGFAIDVGAIYLTQFKGLQLGFNISNFGTDMQISGRDLLNVVDPDVINEGVDNIPVNYETGSFALPLLFRFGISYQLDLSSISSEMTFAVDLLKPNNDQESVNVGMEYLIFDTFALRAGYRSLFLDENTGGLSLGLGLILSPSDSQFAVIVDYAYVDLGLLNAVHNFGLNLRF
ncbi:MAG: PorV/PorQ family protein [Bacteroidetes bacterium]|nr:PorV/PorQ family protein [Bacteroidota bacterium]